MSFQERSSTHSAQGPSQARQPLPKAIRLSAKQMTRLAILAAIAGVFLFSYSGQHVLAKAGQAADAKNAAPAVDPDAVEAVKKMGAYLRTLKVFQVHGDITHDDVLEDGLIVQSNSKVDMLALKPDRMRVEVVSDEKHRLYLYDGKTFTAWGKLTNYYATVPAPPTIPELFKQVQEKFDIELPLIDLFKWGTNEDDINKIKTAIDAGPTTVEGVTCEQYVFHQEGVDWQVWIQLGDYPLPRRLVITTLTDEARPQHTSNLVWNLGPSYNEAAFTFDPPTGALRIPLKDINASGTEKNQ